jgi:hypothetical protein
MNLDAFPCRIEVYISRCEIQYIAPNTGKRYSHATTSGSNTTKLGLLITDLDAGIWLPRQNVVETLWIKGNLSR